MAGHCSLVCVDGSVDVAQPVVADTRIHQRHGIDQLGFQIREGQGALEKLQRMVEAIAEEMRRPEVHQRHGFVIPVATLPGRFDRLVESRLSLVPFALGDQGLSLHGPDVETHVHRRGVRGQSRGLVQNRAGLGRLPSQERELSFKIAMLRRDPGTSAWRW